MENFPASLQDAVEPHERSRLLALEARRIELLDGIGQLAMRDVRPRADDFGWATLVIVQNLEGVLEPSIVTFQMAEAVLQVASALRYQAAKFSLHTRRILRVE